MVQRLIKRAQLDRSILFCCDLQTGFSEVAKHYNEVTNVGIKMAKASVTLNIPICVSEYKPNIFKHTFNRIQSNLLPKSSENVLIFDKPHFSMVKSEQAREFMNQHKERNQAILFGLMTHTSIQQTCMDLISMNYEVFICLDGISSQLNAEHECGFRTMQRIGATLTSSSSVLYEMLKDYNDPKYERIRKIIDDHPTIEENY